MPELTQGHSSAIGSSVLVSGKSLNSNATMTGQHTMLILSQSYAPFQPLKVFLHQRFTKLLLVREWCRE